MSYSKEDGIEKINETLDADSEQKIVGGEGQFFSSITSLDAFKQDKNSTYSTKLPNRHLKRTPLPLSEEVSEGRYMDDNKILEIYMEKIDKDQRELRGDMRERESRIEKQISEVEARENARMNRIEQLIASQNDKVDSLKDKVEERLADDKKYRHTNNIAIALGVIATVISMIGIYYATVSMITDIIGVAIAK